MTKFGQTGIQSRLGPNCLGTACVGTQIARQVCGLIFPCSVGNNYEISSANLMHIYTA